MNLLLSPLSLSLSLSYIHAHTQIQSQACGKSTATKCLHKQDLHLLSTMKHNPPPPWHWNRRAYSHRSSASHEVVQEAVRGTIGLLVCTPYTWETGPAVNKERIAVKSFNLVNHECPLLSLPHRKDQWWSWDHIDPNVQKSYNSEQTTVNFGTAHSPCMCHSKLAWNQIKSHQWRLTR